MSMKNMSIKKMIYPFIIVFIILLTTASLYSFHLGFGFMLSSVILGLLFYYNVKLGFIAFFIILGLFLYARFFPKERQNKEVFKKPQEYKIIKEPDNLENEYDYKGDETEYSYINIDIETPVIEGMSNKKRNSGIDRIATETSLRAKESNSLPISGTLGLYKEPVAVGGDGTMSGYQLIQQE
jgi:membrane protein implicated in regulation of membrane protease activity